MSGPASIDVEGLELSARSGRKLVTDVGFRTYPGETLGLVGESGSGKSLTLRAILGLLPPGVIQTGGRVERRGRCAMVFQDPVRALPPLSPVAALLTEVVRCNRQSTREAARREAMELLASLGLPDSLRREDRYPHELSGGQCQRVVIALALARRPDVLLCDEPTTALDVTVQKQILGVLERLQRELGFGMILVTHNLAVAASLCPRLAVLKEGRVVEHGTTATLLRNPSHPYLRMLIRSVLPLPRLEGGRHP